MAAFAASQQKLVFTILILQHIADERGAGVSLWFSDWGTEEKDEGAVFNTIPRGYAVWRARMIAATIRASGICLPMHKKISTGPANKASNIPNDLG